MPPHRGKILTVMNEWNTTIDGSVADFSPILSAVAASLSSSLWSRAAEHWNGGGAERCLDLRSLRLHLQSLWKRGKHEWFGMIHAVSSASTWTRVRRHMTRSDSCPDAICRRCSTDEIETDFHRIWSCPANRSIDGIEKSQHLLAEASRHWKSCPVFWLRGCIPLTWTQPPDVVEPVLAEEFGPHAHNSSPLHASPRIYRAGAGDRSVASLKPLLTCCGGLNGRQTVPRAELQAFFVLPPTHRAPPRTFVTPWLFPKDFGASGRDNAVFRMATKLERESAEQRDIDGQPRGKPRHGSWA